MFATSGANPRLRLCLRRTTGQSAPTSESAAVYAPHPCSQGHRWTATVPESIAPVISAIGPGLSGGAPSMAQPGPGHGDWGSAPVGGPSCYEGRTPALLPRFPKRSWPGRLPARPRVPRATPLQRSAASPAYQSTLLTANAQGATAGPGLERGQARCSGPGPTCRHAPGLRLQSLERSLRVCQHRSEQPGGRALSAKTTTPSP